MSKIINLLKEFGLSINAAKTYIALLKKNPITGYEVSTQSGVPRSAVYSILKQLESIGIINSLGDSPKKYIPLAPSALLDHFNFSHKHRLEELKDAINNIDNNEESFDFWHIYSYRNLLLKIKETIKISKENLVMSIWNRELKVVQKELREAEKRGVKITIFSFGKMENKIGEQISYNLDELKLRNIWSPKIILVSDHLCTIMGSAKDANNSRSIYTKNDAITEIAVNHIILDITLAGQRLNFDSNPIVKKIMKKPDLHLGKLLEDKKIF